MFDKKRVEIGTKLKNSRGLIGTVVAYNGYYPLRQHSDSVVVEIKERGKVIFSVASRAKTIIINPAVNLIAL